MRTRALAAIALLFLTLPALGVAPVRAQQSLTLEQARIAMDAAEAEARRNQWNLAIVVVDPEDAQVVRAGMAAIGSAAVAPGATRSRAWDD